MVLDMANEMVAFHRVCSRPIEKGLYLGYLKLYSSVEIIHIMTPTSIPNVLPHTKIRDCPNVTSDEWQWLKYLGKKKHNCEVVEPDEEQLNFQLSVAAACTQLLLDLGISENEFASHRLYDVEVIEISCDVSFILLVPKLPNVCAVPGHTEQANNGCIMLPVQVFEMIHMRAYQSDFISRYSRLSSILEIDVHLAQQTLRQAFSGEEVTQARARLQQLAVFQQRLDEAWKAMRWIMDIIIYARDRNVRGGLSLSALFTPPNAETFWENTLSVTQTFGEGESPTPSVDSNFTRRIEELLLDESSSVYSNTLDDTKIKDLVDISCYLRVLVENNSCESDFGYNQLSGHSADDTTRTGCTCRHTRSESEPLLSDHCRVQHERFSCHCFNLVSPNQLYLDNIKRSSCSNTAINSHLTTSSYRCVELNKKNVHKATTARDVIEMCLNYLRCHSTKDCTRNLVDDSQTTTKWYLTICTADNHVVVDEDCPLYAVWNCADKGVLIIRQQKITT